MVRVECYAGWRDDEVPRAVHLDGRRLEVRQVLDQWHDFGVTRDLAVRRIFKVLVESGQVFFLEQDEGSGAWSLRRD